jgi:hypothetical protein
LAAQANRYTASELAQLIQSRRRALVLCFIIRKRALLLDAAADMAIRVWNNAGHRADDYANTRLRVYCFSRNWTFHGQSVSI